MEILKNVASIVEKFESITELHTLIFVAQELGFIPKTYEFDYSLNLPFSEALERDFVFLLYEEKFFKEGLSGEYIVDRKNSSISEKQSDFFNENGIEKLSQCNVTELLNMSRVLYLADKFPKLKDNDIKFEKIRRTFLINSDSIQNIFKQFKILSPNLKFGRVLQ